MYLLTERERERDEQQQAFDQLKEKLTTNPVLALFNLNAKKTEIQTDVSKLGLGAILCKSDENGRMHLVYAINRKTSDVEQNYYSTKLELLAITV